ncbi:flap endonuclease Xni [Alishewanella jeotgali]|uniref:Flap endonuclease-like protein n=1 Tax=Alishewanella jeotgali KCTC 22429 TaxID=1129374 RepID=H3ZHA7_9ALTE|nr:flap endonuclease Xni [Alishewanella jeotgali]EHR40063.1 flap endonuclease-like protein [Alishewanella jeotgali KCTC 22429]
MARVVLIDALNLIRRLYAVQERPYLPLAEEIAETTRQQIISNTRQVLSQALKRLRQDLQPSHALLVFDGGHSSWRQQLCPLYKANRKPMPAILAAALPLLMEDTEQHGMRCFLQAEFEADDVIATIANKVRLHQQEAIIVSTDKGYLPLLTQGVLIYDAFARHFIDANQVTQKFGVAPDKLLSWWALVGDSTNNIPGVSGVGPKSAEELMQLGASLNQALLHPDCPKKLKQKILDQKHDILIYTQVLALQTNLELGLNLQDIRLPEPT